ncbi:MAG: RnfH family protein [Woeseiaceae bacterium]|nr:RnfH family protein [Woeseiaceae bacterium]
MRIEVAWASPDSQLLVAVDLPDGATVADALTAARDASSDMPDWADRPVGVWGRVVPTDAALRDGDRVEVYRQLLIDPREARRQYAAAGGTMKASADRPAAGVIGRAGRAVPTGRR